MTVLAVLTDVGEHVYVPVLDVESAERILERAAFQHIGTNGMVPEIMQACIFESDAYN